MTNDPGQGPVPPQGQGAPQQPQQPQYTPAPPAPTYAGQPAPGAQPSAHKKTNLMAILSLVGAFVFPIAGIILGHISLGQIKKTGEGGRGLGLTGTILGYVFTFLGLIIIIVYFFIFAAVMSDPYMLDEMMGA